MTANEIASARMMAGEYQVWPIVNNEYINWVRRHKQYVLAVCLIGFLHGKEYGAIRFMLYTFKKEVSKGQLQVYIYVRNGYRILTSTDGKAITSNVCQGSYRSGINLDNYVKYSIKLPAY